MSEQISKLVPVFALLAVLILAAAFGAAWNAGTVQIVNTGLWQLEPSYQGIYVQAVADAYALDKNAATAGQRLSFLCQSDGGLQRALEKAGEFYGADPVKAANLRELRTLVDSGRVTQNTDVQVCNLRTIDATAGIMRLAAPIALVLMALAIIGYGVMTVVRANEAGGIRPARAGAPAPAAARPEPSAAAAGRPAPAQAPAGADERVKATRPGLGLFGRRAPDAGETIKSAAARGAEISREVEKTDFSARGVEPPIVQFMTTYLHGDDLYDDSFSIEAPSGEFLGECGVGISDTISGDDGKHVSAFEIWLFDKNDIRTVTKVLMTEHAFTDDATRARLAPKGEAAQARSGEKLLLETATLRVQARIVDLSYGSGPQPPNSFFERITIELAAWKRDDRGGPGPGGGAPPAAGSRVPPTGSRVTPPRD